MHNSGTDWLLIAIRIVFFALFVAALYYGGVGLVDRIVALNSQMNGELLKNWAKYAGLAVFLSLIRSMLGKDAQHVMDWAIAITIAVTMIYTLGADFITFFAMITGAMLLVTSILYVRIAGVTIKTVTGKKATHKAPWLEMSLTAYFAIVLAAVSKFFEGPVFTEAEVTPVYHDPIIAGTVMAVAIFYVVMAVPEGRKIQQRFYEYWEWFDRRGFRRNPAAGVLASFPMVIRIIVSWNRLYSIYLAPIMAIFGIFVMASWISFLKEYSEFKKMQGHGIPAETVE
ncbi:MAG: hypothetical protein PWP76_145 [Candidatus Diapherotrites archaeon]|nr:hypothetical protein [Candidatus Diapherotrites archaeon]